MTTHRSPSDPDTEVATWVYSDVMLPLDVRIAKAVRAEVQKQQRIGWLGTVVACVLGVVLGVVVVLLAQRVGMR